MSEIFEDLFEDLKVKNSIIAKYGTSFVDALIGVAHDLVTGKLHTGWRWRNWWFERPNFNMEYINVNGRPSCLGAHVAARLLKRANVQNIDHEQVSAKYRQLLWHNPVLARLFLNDNSERHRALPKKRSDQPALVVNAIHHYLTTGDGTWNCFLPSSPDPELWAGRETSPRD